MSSAVEALEALNDAAEAAFESELAQLNADCADVVAEAGLVLGAEIGNVHHVGIHQAGDLILEFGRIGVVVVDAGRQEAADQQAAALFRR